MIAVNNHSNNSMKELNDDLQAKASSDMDGKNGNSSSTVVVVSQPAQETKRKGTSELETIMHIIKANIGTGVLAMPYAFNCGGLVLSSVSIWIMAVIAIHCMHILIDLYKYVMASSANDPSKKVSDTISYDEVVELAMRERLQRSSSPSGLFSANSNLPKYCRLFVSAFIIMAQLGGCCVYLIFIPTNIKQVIDFYNPVDKWSLKLVMTCVVLPLAAFCLVKSLKVLAPFSALANTLMLSSMLVIIYELVSGTLKPFDQLDLVAPVSKLPLFYSTAIYAFEGIPLVLPVHHEMKSKVNYTPWNGVLNTGMFMVAAMYFSIGFYGYLKYGHDSKASITLNLPVEDVLFQIIKICFAVAIFISYNLQFGVAAGILWKNVQRSSSTIQSLTPSKQWWAESLFRLGLVALTFVLAVSIPQISLFISLIGAVTGSFLALLIPPTLDLIILWPLSNWSIFKLVKNIVIILFGFYVFIAGTYLSVQDIVDYFTG